MDKPASHQKARFASTVSVVLLIQLWQIYGLTIIPVTESKMKTICLTGGISPYYAPYLPEEMQAAVAEPAAEPLIGAVALARAFAEELGQ